MELPLHTVGRNQEQHWLIVYNRSKFWVLHIKEHKKTVPIECH